MRSSSSQGLEDASAHEQRPAAQTQDPALLPPRGDGDGAAAGDGVRPGPAGRSDPAAAVGLWDVSLESAELNGRFSSAPNTLA